MNLLHHRKESKAWKMQLESTDFIKSIRKWWAGPGSIESIITTSIPCLWKEDKGEMTEKAPEARASPLLPLSFPLVSPHIRSPLLFLTSVSVCLFLIHCIRHHERFTALLLADLADQALPHARRHNPALTDLRLSRETKQREEDRTKVGDDYRATAPLCVFLCVRACRLGIQRSTWWRVLFVPEWACDVWQMTDSINFFPLHVCKGTHTSGFADTDAG